MSTINETDKYYSVPLYAELGININLKTECKTEWQTFYNVFNYGSSSKTGNKKKMRRKIMHLKWKTCLRFICVEWEQVRLNVDFYFFFIFVAFIVEKFQKKKKKKVKKKINNFKLTFNSSIKWTNWQIYKQTYNFRNYLTSFSNTYTHMHAYTHTYITIEEMNLH